jgi:hypothetical protein
VACARHADSIAVYAAVEPQIVLLEVEAAVEEGLPVVVVAEAARLAHPADHQNGVLPYNPSQ